jgi:hypothetical protein
MEGFCDQPATKEIAMNVPETTAYRSPDSATFCQLAPMKSIHSTRPSPTSTDRAQGPYGVRGRGFRNLRANPGPW